MRVELDLKQLSQIVILFVIGAIVAYMFYGMIQMSERNPEKQAEKIEEVISKGLVQCYALEGSFPADVRYLEKYGILFEEDKYHYVYDVFGVNYVPQITVVPVN